MTASDQPHPGDPGIGAPAGPELASLLTVGVFVSDADGRCTYVNERWCELSGLEADATVGHHWWAGLHPDDVEGVTAAWQRFAHGDEPFSMEFRFVGRDGQARGVRGRARSHLDDQGQVTRCVGTVTGLGDGRATLARIMGLIERSSDMVVVIDAAGAILWANAATERVLGYDRSAKFGTPVLDLVHPDDAARATEGLARSSQESDLAPIRVRVQASDGAWREVEVVSTNMLDEPLIRGIVLSARDITERRRLERRIHELEHSFEASIRYSPVGRALIDLDGRWLQVNTAFADMVGRHPNDLIGRPGIESVHPDDRPRVRAETRRVQPGEVDSVTVDVRFLRPDGDAVWGRSTVWFVLDDRGEPLYYASDITDVTEVRAAREAQDRAQREFEALIEQSSDLITVNDLAGTITYVSPSASSVLGYDPAELIGTEARDLVHPDDVARVEQTTAEQFARGVAEPIQYRARHRDGSWRVLEAIVTDMINEPSVQGVVTNGRDITERRVAERRASELVEILEAANELVVVSAPAGEIVYANRSARTLLGAHERGHVSALSSERSRERLRTEIMPLVRQRGSWSGELELVDPDGRLIPVAVTVQAHRDENGTLVRVATVAHDISDLKAAQRRLEFEATHDALTGLPNRTLFREIGDRALARGARTNEAVAVLFLDLDGFKLVNDSYGHDTGDLLLGMVAQRLREAVRAGDVLARLGGDEFVILCEHPRTEKQVLDLSDRIIETVSAPFTIADNLVHVGVSIGIAFSHGSGAGIAELIREADIALYRAKSDGRGRAQLYDEMLLG